MKIEYKMEDASGVMSLRISIGYHIAIEILEEE